jgi:hypothetical protein
MGPFITSTLTGLLTGKCCNCGREISDLQIFGNAFILEEDIVKLKCTQCRIGNKAKVNEVKVFRSVINRKYVLIEMNDRLLKGKGDYLDLFLGLRNFTMLQHTYTYENAFDIPYTRRERNLPWPDHIYPDVPRHIDPIQKTFGDIKRLECCGECGVTLHLEDRPDIEKSGKCWACGLPNEFQWNMRISFNELESRLQKYNNVLPNYNKKRIE